MEDLLDTLLFRGDLSPEERSSIQAQMEDDPALADAWIHWCEVRRRLRRRLQEHVSDRRLLVLHVLEQEGATDALTARERAALSEARGDVRQAVEALPALELIVDRIRDELADFEDVWTAHIAGEEALMGQPVEGAPSSARERVPERTDRAPRGRSGDRSPQWTRRLVTAGLVVIIGVLAVLYWPDGERAKTITVAEGQTQVQKLADGSRIRLVGPATFSYEIDGQGAQTRQVELTKGQAFFDVQHREETPFVVQTPTAKTTVLGTQFGVTTRGDTTEVVLASGSVQVASRGETIDSDVVLEPGQRSWVAAAEAPAPPSPVDLTSALEWTGLFVFRSVPLQSIADRLGDRYDARISVAAPIMDATVTGTFERNQPVEEVVNALAATLGAEVEHAGDKHYKIVPRSD